MLSSCLTQVTDGEATRGLKLVIILLIKKKYRKQHAAVGYKQRKEDKKERGEIENENRWRWEMKRASAMTQLNLAG